MFRRAPLPSAPSLPPSLSPPLLHYNIFRLPREQGTRRRKWSDEEDAKLVELVRSFGLDNWRAVGQQMRQRDAKQCRERYLNHLDPNVKKGKLTLREWKTLIEAHDKFGNKCGPLLPLPPPFLPSFLPLRSRSFFLIYTFIFSAKWRVVLVHPSLTSDPLMSPLTSSDQRLLPFPFPFPSSSFPSPCSLRWSDIAQLIPGRTPNTLKNFWHSNLRALAIKEIFGTEAYSQGSRTSRIARRNSPALMFPSSSSFSLFLFFFMILLYCYLIRFWCGYASLFLRAL